MGINRRQLFGLAAGAAALPVPSRAADWEIQKGPFTPDWDSLLKYRCPEWFRDAKLGIWAVWGPQCVAENDQWYARNMYIEGSSAYKHHVQHYGHPSKFGFKDLVPLWKAENWNAGRLMSLYQKAGARYFIALSTFHDNFDCFNSRHHRWNCVNMGPKKDITGIWRKTALEHGLRFGVTEHAARAWSWFNVNKGADKSGPHAGIPYDGNDPKYQDFYFPPHEDTNPAYPKDPPESYVQNWFLRIRDLIDSYQPDLMYYDGGVPFGEAGRRLVAHMYNQSVRWHAGRNEAAFNIKNMIGRTDHGEYREGTCVLDMERGVVQDVWPIPWQTDTCIGNWYYEKGVKYKSVASVVHMLADIVSKNGNLLLNIPPKADGTLDGDEENFLAGLGAWMNVNGEAIYGTRPWKKSGEGRTQSVGGNFGEGKTKPYAPEDIRFTRKGKTLYAISLGLPEKVLTIRSLAGLSVQSVHMLGLQEPLGTKRGDQGLVVEIPDRKPCRDAIALRIEGAPLA